ncbi:cell wall hydrolase [Paenibacillus chungangensis]|uniref:Cell wall hydrolase n=1 Tax=Paenibacillus chungangensis TaxID=696535 RepID=A0ABW3HKX1_9BACL
MNHWTRKKLFIGTHSIAMTLVLFLLCMAPAASVAAAEQVKVAENISISMNGEVVELNDPLLLKEKRLFVPVASVAKLFGGKAEWNGDNQEVTVKTTLGDSIVFGVDIPIVYFNEGRYVLEDLPFLEAGRMYLPLRQAAELMHATVKWDEEARVAELVAVPLAVISEEYGFADAVKEHGFSEQELLQRNGLESEDSIEAGAKLRVVVPSVLDNEAKPFTEEEFMLLAKLTQVESGYESYEGQLGVANVVLNRVKDSRFPGTIRDVIYSGRQFPPAHNGLLDKSKPNKSVLRAAKDALNGKNNVEGALYFHNPKVSKGKFWSSLDSVVTIGNHRFAK